MNQDYIFDFESDKSSTKRNGKTTRNHPLNHPLVHDSYFFVDVKGNNISDSYHPNSMDKQKRWEEIEQTADKVFYTTRFYKPPVKVVTHFKPESEIEKELEISRAGRQKRKEKRKNEALLKQNHRKSHRPVSEEKEAEEVKESPRREEEESEEEKGSNVNVLIETNNSDRLLKAQTLYKRQQKNDRKPQVQKARHWNYDYPN